MKKMQNKLRRLLQRWLYWVLALLINATGHALTIAANLGSAVWTASAVNIYHLWPLSLRMTLFLCGFVVALVNAALIHHFSWWHFIGNLGFVIPFSILIQFFVEKLAIFKIGSWPLILQISVDIIGVMMVALATSIYQRVNLILHPNDDLMQILRYRYLHGSAARAQMVHYVPPLMIMLVTFVWTHHLWAVNIGTLFCLLFQGSLIGFFDTHIFRKLKHYQIQGLHT
ncbi:putative sugar specific permease (putative) [Lactobacillus selangorensis]|uniref:Putative sugar specific permease (Putative) n=1 Tax=Lactobacillus selangorensis TaxID=81857 RepID=A0A0R2FZ61_9LACO|nr:hypothetical protein [Lactobacillus selangorensis]KRN27579.1 putative sugar specific permease (putative) [Lactobacillus selangorensis]KRN30148.1 putative sugar specific permease (putative) [Lactobacillus selangorensis]